MKQARGCSIRVEHPLKLYYCSKAKNYQGPAKNYRGDRKIYINDRIFYINARKNYVSDSFHRYFSPVNLIKFNTNT